MMQKVVNSRPDGLRIIETLECGHTNDCVNPSTDGEVDCIQCDLDFIAATPARVLEKLRNIRNVNAE
jgi:hypothetical protein